MLQCHLYPSKPVKSLEGFLYVLVFTGYTAAHRLQRYYIVIQMSGTKLSSTGYAVSSEKCHHSAE